MSGRFFLSGLIPLFEGAAQPLSTLTFSLTGTSTAQATYSDSGLTAANTNPVVADANGYFGEIFLTRNRYKVIWKNAAGTTLKTWDPVDKERIMTRGAGLPSDPHPGQLHDNTSDGRRYEYKINTAAWLDLGPTDAVGNTASVTEQLTGTETAKYSTPDSVAALVYRGAAITPSAGTVSLPSTGGKTFAINAGNFSAISSAQGGREVIFVFGGSSLITHNATSMILPGGANITTEAGDTACFINEAAADASGSNWRCVWFQRDSTTLAPPVNYAATQAEMEAGSSNLRWVTPGRQHFHPSAAKAWINFNGSGTPAARQSYNVSSITDNGLGDYTLNFTTSFSGADYAFTATCGSATSTNVQVAYQASAAPTASAFRFRTSDLTAAALVDATWIGAAFFGDFA